MFNTYYAKEYIPYEKEVTVTHQHEASMDQLRKLQEI
jgi:hypothetical protein